MGNPQTYEEHIKEIELKIENAMKYRELIVNRIKDICLKIHENPNEQKFKNQLGRLLGREEHFLEQIEEGSAETEETLKNVLETVQAAELPEGAKAELQVVFKRDKKFMINSIKRLIDVSKFVQKKTDVIKRRVDFGKQMVESDRFSELLDDFAKTLSAEAKIDKKIAKKYNWELRKIEAGLRDTKKEAAALLFPVLLGAPLASAYGAGGLYGTFVATFGILGLLLTYYLRYSRELFEILSEEVETAKEIKDNSKVSG